MSKRGMKPQQAAEIRKRKGLPLTKLRKVRVSRGYSQSDLAALSGVPVGRIQHYEQNFRGIEGARIETLCDLAIALNCSLEDLIESKEVITKLRMAK